MLFATIMNYGNSHYFLLKDWTLVRILVWFIWHTSISIIILFSALPMVIVIFFYSQILKAVIAHESALKAQAKKMNVDSLRSNAVSL